ncbi:MAG: RHS repeat-associated core domain-containing protein, partial [Candidatus Micrarchaeota archaeon]
ELQEDEYYAFGEMKSSSGSGNNYKYTGKELDTDTGLYYYGARYYEPEIGRFLQADAVWGNFEDPLSLNRYVYVKNNPLKYVDPDGRAPEDKQSNIDSLANAFMNEKQDSPLGYVLRQAGAGLVRLSSKEPQFSQQGMLNLAGIALIAMGQPTSLKEDIESGTFMGMGSISKVGKGGRTFAEMLSAMKTETAKQVPGLTSTRTVAQIDKSLEVIEGLKQIKSNKNFGQILKRALPDLGLEGKVDKSGHLVVKSPATGESVGKIKLVLHGSQEGAPHARLNQISEIRRMLLTEREIAQKAAK